MMMSSGNKQQEAAGPKLFSSRILSRDRSTVANASFRVYYSLGAGKVPFVWESKPGTPKSAATPASINDTTVPPISPPPSYLAKSSHQSRVRKCGKKAASRPICGWIGWLTSFSIRGRSTTETTDHRQRWLAADRGVDEDERRRPRCSTSCF